MEQLTKEIVAKVLDGTEYGSEDIATLSSELKANGLVVATGASDDLLRFDGAIYDEVGACDGTTARVDKDGPIPDWESLDKDNEAEVEKYFQRKNGGKKVTAQRCVGDYSWVIDAEVPYAVFDIMEDGEKFCRGIVFSINDL